MAEPSEQELANLLQSPTGFHDVAQRLQREVVPVKADPYQAAYDELNTLTEDSFREIINSPIGGQNQLLATAQLAQTSRDARQRIDIAKEPALAFGGNELISVFENQQDDQFPLNARDFSRRVQLAGILRSSAPEKFDEFMDKRNKMNEEDRALFDRAFDQEFGSFVEENFSANGVYTAVKDDSRFESPRQKKLWEDFWGGDNSISLTSQKNESDQWLDYLRETKGNDWVEANLSSDYKLNRSARQAREFAAGVFGQGVQKWYAAFTTTADAVTGATSLLPREAIEGVTGQEIPSPTITSLIDVATGKDRQQQALFAGKLAEGLANETLRPENVYLIAVSSGLYATGVGAPAGGAVQGNVVRTVASRVVTNAMIGGFANSGAAWARDDDQNIKSLADDFVIGAFIEASVPEVMAAYASVRGTRYNREAVLEALEASSAKTRSVASITDDSIVILDTAPRSATLADVGVTNIHPNGTHLIDPELKGSVDEAYTLAIDAQTNAGRLQQELTELERKYANQASLRDSVARARRGGAGSVAGAEELVTDNQLAMARERAARSAATARNSARTLNSISDAAARQYQEKLVQANRTGQGINLTESLKPDAEGVITLNGDEAFFRGVDNQFVSAENPLATPRRGVNITPDKRVADQFAERNTTTGAAIEGEVLDVRAPSGTKLLAANGAKHDSLMEAIVNDPEYQKVPVGQRQQWRDDFMEKQGYQGVLIYKQGLPVVRMFDASQVRVASQLNANFAEIDRIASLVDNEVLQNANAVNSLLSDLRDPLQSSFAIRRLGHHISASISGRLPGSMQIVADAAINLRRALDELTNPVVEKLALQADDLLRRELNTIRYVGPAKWEKWATQYKREIFLSRPDLFRGQSGELSTALRKVQSLGDAKVAMLQGHNYNIKQLDGYYFPQFWENDPKAIQSVLRGKVSVAKERLYGDVIEGLENGLIPRNMSVRDTLVSHDKMLNQAFGDAAFRNTMVRRGLAKKGTPSVASKTYAFDSPLFGGLIADKQTVQAVDSYFNVPPTAITNVRGFAERVKNTSFGLFDLGVFGIQGASAIVKGGWFAVVGELTDNIMLRSIPGAAKYENEAETFWKVLYSRHGGVLGTVSSGYDFEAGTLIGAVGLKKLDRVVTEQYMDRLSRLQFDTALTPVRLSIFKGHLFMQHLLGQDVNDTRVLRAAAEAANRATLTSRGAQTANRRSLESALLTSASSARAELANTVSPLRPLADLVTTGKINGPEAVAAWVGFAHLAAMYYGIQWTVNKTLNQPDDYFNPMDKDSWRKFGYIRVGGKEIALIKERSIVKAMQQSFEGLSQQDPEYVAEVWSKVFIGKLSPAVSAVASLGTGYGYDEQGFFQTGELSTRSKLLNFVPFPLAIEKAYLQPNFRSDPVAMTLEFFGYNQYDLSVIDRRDDFVRAHNPYEASDVRHADVEANGYAGMERAEAQIFRQEHPEFFNGKNNLSGESKRVFDEADKVRSQLLELENEVRNDPFKRREYRERRQDLMARMGELFKGKKSKDVTLQDKVQTIYYETINQFRSQQPGETFYGDDFGIAEEAARRSIESQYGENGIAALDRALVVGSTALETEYRTARRTISDSGFYDISDAVVAAKSGGVWATYHDFRESVNELAAEKGVVPEQLPSFRDMDALIADAKEKFRERNPHIDAQLVIWDGLTPRSEAAQQEASKALGRSLELAKEVRDRMKKQQKAATPDTDFEDIIRRFQ